MNPTETTRITPIDTPSSEEVHHYGPSIRIIDTSAGNRLVLTVAEAGKLLGISRAFAYELVARGELPVIRLGRRVVVPKAALFAMVGVDPSGN